MVSLSGKNEADEVDTVNPENEHYNQIKRNRLQLEKEFEEDPSAQTAKSLVDILKEEVQLAQSLGLNEEVNALQKEGLRVYREYVAHILLGIQASVRMGIDRENDYIQFLKEGKKEAGLFSRFSSKFASHDPYQLQIDKANQQLKSLKYIRDDSLAKAFEGLAKGPEADYDDIANQTRIAKESLDLWTKAADVQTDVWDREQEALSISRDAAVTVITLPAVFVSGAATAGVKGAAKLGAGQGAKLATLTSGAANIDDVSSGKKTVGEGVRDTVADGAKGAAAGAALGGALSKAGQGIKSAVEKSRRSASTVSSSAKSASARPAGRAADKARPSGSTQRPAGKSESAGSSARGRAEQANSSRYSPNNSSQSAGARSRPGGKSSSRQPNGRAERASGTGRSRPAGSSRRPGGRAEQANSSRYSPNSNSQSAGRSKPGAKPGTAKEKPTSSSQQPGKTQKPEAAPSGKAYKPLNPKDSPYKILGVERGASKDAINKAFRDKNLRYSPDRASGNKEDAQILLNAYDEVMTKGGFKVSKPLKD